MAQLQTIGADELHFDPKNPRLAEFAELTDETATLKLLWKEMDVKELVMSILANHFFENEPLYVIREDNKWIVLEGNRRLAAVKAILNPERIPGMVPFEERITSELQQELKNGLPVVEMESREKAWRLIGFKHVKGAAKWDSYAKAKYIAQVRRDYNVSLSEIADQIGDSKRTTLRLYKGIVVVEQAEQMTEFRIDDVYYNRFYFSHLYTAIAYEGYYKFLGIEDIQSDELTIPQDHAEQLLMVMRWLFGSKDQNIEPVVKKQNPDLIHLSKVLLNSESVQILSSTNNLDRAYDSSLDGNAVIKDSIIAAKLKIEDAQKKLSLFDGSKDIMESCQTMVTAATALFDSMKLIYSQKKNSGSNRFSIDD